MNLSNPPSRLCSHLPSTRLTCHTSCISFSSCWSRRRYTNLPGRSVSIQAIVTAISQSLRRIPVRCLNARDRSSIRPIDADTSPDPNGAERHTSWEPSHSPCWLQTANRGTAPANNQACINSPAHLKAHIPFPQNLLRWSRSYDSAMCCSSPLLMRKTSLPTGRS